MADLSTEIPFAAALTGAELLPLQQGSGAAKVTSGNLVRQILGLSQDIGIGTNSPLSLGSGIRTLQIKGTTSGTGGGIRLTSSDDTLEAAFYAATGGAILSTTGAHPLTIRTANLERSRWDASGNWIHGKVVADQTTDGVYIAPGGTISSSATGNAGLIANRKGTNGVAVALRKDGTDVGSITVSASATAYNTSSDHRLKTNVQPLAMAITRLKELPVHRFKWLNDPDGPYVDGFLAHEAQAVVPESVTGEKDGVEEIGDATGYRERDTETGLPILGTLETLTGILQSEVPEGYTWTRTGVRPVYQGIDQSKLVPLLTAALQEAVSRIEALEAAA